MTPDEKAAAVERLITQALEQGLSRHVSDPVVIEKLAVILEAAAAREDEGVSDP
jgi:hypothetical protein